MLARRARNAVGSVRDVQKVRVVQPLISGGNAGTESPAGNLGVHSFTSSSPRSRQLERSPTL